MNPPKEAKYYFTQISYVLSLESLHFLAKRYSVSLKGDHQLECTRYARACLKN